MSSEPQKGEDCETLLAAAMEVSQDRCGRDVTPTRLGTDMVALTNQSVEDIDVDDPSALTDDQVDDLLDNHEETASLVEEICTISVPSGDSESVTACERAWMKHLLDADQFL